MGNSAIKNRDYYAIEYTKKRIEILRDILKEIPKNKYLMKAIVIEKEILHRLENE